MTTPKPSADRMTVEALRGVLRQIETEAQFGLSTKTASTDALFQRIAGLARRALAATEGK